MITPSDTIRRLITITDVSEPDEWTAEEIDVALRRYAQFVSHEPLTPVPSYEAGTGLVYKRYEHRLGDWSADTFLQDGDHAVLSPDEAAIDKGVWTFTSNTASPVYITGTTFDVYAAAATLLEAKAAAKAGDLVSFSAQNGSYSYAPKSKQYMQIAKKYRAMARVGAVELRRSDLNV